MILKKKKIVLLLTSLLGSAIVAVVALTYFISGENEGAPEVWTHPGPSLPSEQARGNRATLKAMTLNLAHGRRDGSHQALQEASSIRSNLDAVAEVLSRIKPDVVALQEADGPSIWSGNFNHVRYLAEKAGYPYSVQGAHVQGMGLTYGTALLSMLPLKNPLSITFPPTPPTFSKGFVVSTVQWPGTPEVEIDLVSVHLDFLSHSVRCEQVDVMVDRLSERKRPRIVMGDFNAEWPDEDSPLRTLAEKLDLKAFQPDAAGLHTFPTRSKRLDWILLSPELKFSTYEVLPDLLSDHQGVAAVLRRSD